MLERQDGDYIQVDKLLWYPISSTTSLDTAARPAEYRHVAWFRIAESTGVPQFCTLVPRDLPRTVDPGLRRTLS
jgi:hypothetical protein